MAKKTRKHTEALLQVENTFGEIELKAIKDYTEITLQMIRYTPQIFSEGGSECAAHYLFAFNPQLKITILTSSKNQMQLVLWDYLLFEKITAVLRMLCYGVSADFVDEYARIRESTAIESMKRFVTTIVEIFSEEYLRSPTDNDIAKLLATSNQRGFPGMLGSIDCMHWKWKNCPAAWKCSHNDLNVLDRSPVFSNLIEGRAPPVNYSINGHNYTMGYYLADGIYPPWATFVKTISAPQGNKRKFFAQAQEII